MDKPNDLAKCLRAFGMILDCIEQDPSLAALIEQERNRDVIARYTINVQTGQVMPAPPTPLARIAELESKRAATRDALKHYKEVESSGRSVFIKENGRHGGSPWAELCDAINAP